MCSKLMNLLRLKRLPEIYLSYEERLRQHPDFIEPEIRLKAREKAENEPIDLTLLTTFDVNILVNHIMEHRSVLLESKGHNGIWGFTYINGTTVLNKSKDPYTYYKKEIALRYFVAELVKRRNADYVKLKESLLEGLVNTSINADGLIPDLFKSDVFRVE